MLQILDGYFRLPVPTTLLLLVGPSRLLLINDRNHGHNHKFLLHAKPGGGGAKKTSGCAIASPALYLQAPLVLHELFLTDVIPSRPVGWFT